MIKNSVLIIAKAGYDYKRGIIGFDILRDVCSVNGFDICIGGKGDIFITENRKFLES